MPLIATVECKDVNCCNVFVRRAVLQEGCRMCKWKWGPLQSAIWDEFGLGIFLLTNLVDYGHNMLGVSKLSRLIFKVKS